MKEEWLLRGAVVPVDVETTTALVAEIKRLIDVVGGMALAQPEQDPVACKECHLKDTVYDLLGDLKVANLKLSVRAKRTLIGLTDEEREQVINANTSTGLWHMAKDIETKLKEKNSG